ncbi:hypothetical protein B0H15DRAFT_813957 [Mycena belliarum]|uniref:Uncharacterized protein n=1 Tax=Mycena belliarum TaxID=1033014 RepID=A0AAD6XTJ6_9AGAR|nr:hypothetical protein B0H15DRAFT_813957 [Mycena belliae]
MTTPDHAALVRKHEDERQEHLARTGEPLRRRAERSDSGKKRGPNKGKARAKSGAAGKGTAGKQGDESASDGGSGGGSDDEDSGDEGRAPTTSTRAAPRTSASAAMAAATPSIALPSAPAAPLAAPSSVATYRHYAPFNPEAFDPASFDFAGLVPMPGLGPNDYSFGANNQMHDSGASNAEGPTSLASLDVYAPPLQLHLDAPVNAEAAAPFDTYGGPLHHHGSALAGALGIHSTPLQFHLDAPSNAEGPSSLASLDIYAPPLQLHLDAPSNAEAASSFASLDIYAPPLQLHLDAPSNAEAASSFDSYGVPLQHHSHSPPLQPHPDASDAASPSHTDVFAGGASYGPGGVPLVTQANELATPAGHSAGGVVSHDNYGGRFPSDYPSSTYTGIEGIDRTASGTLIQPSEATRTASNAVGASHVAGLSCALAPINSEQAAKKRKGDTLEKTTSAKKVHKAAAAGDSIADATAPRKGRKERSDKGKRKKDREEEENEPAPRKRKVRSDAGKPRKKRDA